jgi:hypothetical protein
MSKPKKGALHQILVPLVDSTDFASVESGITESDFNSGATRKFYGVNTGGSAAVTSGTISKAGSLVRSGVFRLTLKTTENNYDQMMVRINKTGCAEQIICWENVDNDDSDLLSAMTVIQSMASDAHSAAAQGNSRVLLVQSRLSDLDSRLLAEISDVNSAAHAGSSRALLNQSRISDVQSYLVAMSDALSDAHSDLRSYLVGLSGGLSDVQSALSDAHSDLASKVGAITVSISASDISDIASAVVAGLPVVSQISDIYSLLSDLNSNILSRVPKEVAARSQLSDLSSDLLSYLTGMSGMLSDTHSAATAGSSRALLGQSGISDLQSYLVALSGALSDVESQIDAGMEIGASSLSDIRSAVTAAGMGAAGSDPTTVPAVNASYGAKLDWLTAVSRNKFLQTATTQSVRNDGDSADIASAAVSDDGTTYTRGKFA